MLDQLVEAKIKLVAFLTAVMWGSIGVDQTPRIDAADWVVFSISNVDFRIATIVSILAGVGTTITIIWTLTLIHKAVKTNRGLNNDKPERREKM